VPNGDPAGLRRALRARGPLPGLSFSYPPAAGGPAMCWLKRDVVPRVEASCCVSGVRGAGVIEPRAGDIEYSIDRLGGDYRSFETTPDAKGKACADACQSENRCRAWTYRRPGYGVTVPHCYLKDTIKPPRHRPVLYFGRGAVERATPCRRR